MYVCSMVVCLYVVQWLCEWQHECIVITLLPVRSYGWLIRSCANGVVLFVVIAMCDAGVDGTGRLIQGGHHRPRWRFTGESLLYPLLAGTA